MSDLISRSKLLESFGKSYCGHLGMENSDGMITFRSICRIINEQPTAYDIDKVVEELEKLADENYKAYCIAFNSDDRAEYDAYTNAIEIVKQGGVVNNVCEWRLCDEEANVYDTSCRNPHILIEGTPRENNYEYCPHCGKKIKVVE